MRQEETTLAPESKVWIYQSKEPIIGEHKEEINAHLGRFANSWVSHNRALKASANIINDHFIVLMVDETHAGASGCSIDSSVHFIQSLENAYNLSLFDRMNFAFFKEEKVTMLNKDDFAAYYQQGEISDDTLVFDTLVKTKHEFDTAFTKPLKSSWHKRFV